MKLFVGLGNPGSKYEKTRHNIGFLAIDAIVKAYGFSAERSKFQGLMSEGRLGSIKALTLKPTTFMNLSGQSVGEAMRFYRLGPEDIYVFHDELDLAPGKIKAKTGGGHAGHNGLRSLHEHIGPDFHRIRIGIGHPGDKNRVSGYVLHDFAKADWEWIDPLLDGVVDGAPLLAADNAPGFMTKVSLKMKPPANQRRDSAKPAAQPTSPTPKAEEAPQTAALSPLEKLMKRFSRD